MLTGIKRLNSSQYKELIGQINQEAVFVAEIDGKDIRNLKGYLEAVWKAFHFPDTGFVNYYAYLDWIRDLDWLKSTEYVFVINNSNKLLKQSLRERQIIMDSLEQEVIPWWESEITHYQAEGKPKSFSVLLVD